MRVARRSTVLLIAQRILHLPFYKSPKLLRLQNSSLKKERLERITVINELHNGTNAKICPAIFWMIRPVRNPLK
jgi:hypothetical protein